VFVRNTLFSFAILAIVGTFAGSGAVMKKIFTPSWTCCSNWEIWRAASPSLVNARYSPPKASTARRAPRSHDA
jgi:hypothetical protein